MEDILLITVDSLRADRVQRSDETLTPNIDQLAADGLSCEHAYANGIPTYFSFKSILGGVHSLSCDRGIGLPKEINPLAEELSDIGYTTAGFNAANPWLTPQFGYDRGFDHFQDFLSDDDSGRGSGLLNLMRDVQGRLRDGSPLRNWLGYSGRLFCIYAGIDPIYPGERLTDAAISWFTDQPDADPLFVWIHYMDPHYPWLTLPDHQTDTELTRADVARLWHNVATSNYDAAESDRMVPTARRLYDANVRTMDADIGRLLTQFQEQRAGEPHIILTSDHGTELGDHCDFSHGPDQLFQEIIHVPLIMSSPEIDAGSVTQPVGLVDIPATIADLTPIAAHDFDGDSLLRPTDQPVVSEVIYDAKPASNENMSNDSLLALTDPPWKLIYNDHTDTAELYNIKRDPAESEDLSNQHPERTRELHRSIEEHREQQRHRNRSHAEIHSMRQFLKESYL